MTSSLLDYARNPIDNPDPLPDLADRRTRRSDGFTIPTAWPVDLLPAGELAEDLTRRGVSYRHGVGYAADGERLEPDQVARIAADILDEAAEAIQADRVVVMRQIITETDDAIWAAFYAEAENPANEGLPAEVVEHLLSSAMLFAGGHLLPGQPPLAALDDADDVRARGERSALRLTAKDLRLSRAARARLVALVRPHLRPPTVESPDGQAASAFLATLDDRATLRRSEVSFLYSEAGNPGNLPPAELRALAGERWGDPRKVRGHFTYRPSAA